MEGCCGSLLCCKIAEGTCSPSALLCYKLVKRPFACILSFCKPQGPSGGEYLAHGLSPSTIDSCFLWGGGGGSTTTTAEWGWQAEILAFSLSQMWKERPWPLQQPSRTQPVRFSQQVLQRRPRGIWDIQQRSFVGRLEERRAQEAVL